MSKTSYDASLESIDRRIEQLRARRRDAVARHERRERSARASACMALGEAVLSWYGGWRELDPRAFRGLLARLGDERPALAARGAAGGAPTTEEALRAYRAMRRDVAVAEGEADGGDPS